MELSLGDYLKNSLILPHNPKLHLYFFFLDSFKGPFRSVSFPVCGGAGALTRDVRDVWVLVQFCFLGSRGEASGTLPNPLC